MNRILLVTDRLQEAVARFAGVAPFSRYVDPSAIAVVAARGRRGPTGKRAECHFTRFRETREPLSLDGRWRIPEIRLSGREVRYVISFVFPRFLFLPAEEQAKDIVHELLHIDESFDGRGSARKHGVRYDAAVERLARRALDAGVEMPSLAGDGDIVYFKRFRPFPRPYRVRDPGARTAFDENDLEIAAIRLDARDRMPPPSRYVYECPVCRKHYRRQKPLVAASSCGECASGYDARFRLVLTRPRVDDSLREESA